MRTTMNLDDDFIRALDVWRRRWRERHGITLDRTASVVYLVRQSLDGGRDVGRLIEELEELLERQMPQGISNAARHIAACIEDLGR